MLDEVYRVRALLVNVFRRCVRAVEQSHALQGVVLATVVVLPFVIFLVTTSRVLLPLNVLPECCGWNYTDTEWKPLNIQISDVVDFILPMKIYTYDALKAGDLPLWNPYFFGGGELFSNSQSAALHPANILYFITGPLTAHTLSVLLSIYVMIFFSYLLLRRVGVGAVASLIGALLYISIPWVMFWLEWGTIAWVMAVWPGILYFLYVFRDSGYRNFVAYAIATLLVGVQFYFGHMQFAMFTLGIVLLWWLIALLYGERRKLILALGIVSVVVGVLIGSLSIMNTVVMSQQSHRSGVQAVGIEAILASDVQPQLSPTVVKVDPQFYVPTTIQPEITRFLLAVGALLGIIALYRRHKLGGDSHVLVLLVLLWLIGIGFAWSLPVFRQTLAVLPVGRGMLHHYFIAISVFAAPFIAAIVLDKVIAYTHRVSFDTALSKQMIVRIVVVTLSLLCLVLSLSGVMVFASDKTATLSVGLVPLGAVALMLLTMVFEKRQRWVRGLTMVVAVVTILVSYFLFFYATNPMPNKFGYNVGNPLYQCIKDDALARHVQFPRALSVLSSNSHMTYGIGVMSGYDSLYPLRTKIFHDAFNYPEEQHKTYGDNALLDVNFKKLDLYKSLGINYVIAYMSDSQPEGFVPICRDPTGRYQVYASVEKNEAVYMAAQNLQLSDEEQLERIKNNLLTPSFIMSELPTEEYGSSDVRSYTIKGDEIRVQAHTLSGGALFIAQTYNEGWHASVNGEPVKIYRADYNFMVVPLASGDSTVVFTFRPKYFYLSLAGTTAGLVMLVGISLVETKHITRLRRSG